MRKTTLKERIQYKFDILMSKGSAALVGVLFLATSIVAIIVGALLIIVTNNTNWGENIWNSIMHIIDAGTITGAALDNTGYLVLMSIATLCGLFVTSILIGIITTGFEKKLEGLKKGNSRVLEKDHTIILGYNPNIYTIISELLIANENRNNACIVILAEEEKEIVETDIYEKFKYDKHTRIIVRTGSITDGIMLSKCSIETARSIIINEEEDFKTIKSILSINNYMNQNMSNIKCPPIVSTINEKSNYEATKIISMGNLELILVEDFISRIMALVCRQPGLSNVLIELFDYDGDELYFETFPELEGKKFSECLNMFDKAIVFGYCRNDIVNLNPEMNTILEKDDELIILVEDDGLAKTTTAPIVDITKYETDTTIANIKENILIIGHNSLLDTTIKELDSFFHKGSNIIIADNNFNKEDKLLSSNYENVTIEYKECDTTKRDKLESLLSNEISHVLLLSNENEDNETSDSLTLIKLLHLRDIASKYEYGFNITSQLQNIENQKLAQSAEVKDLVIGSNIINLILTQVSENRKLAGLFSTLLTADGPEIHIRAAEHYVKLNIEMNFYEVTQLLAKRNEIAIGYKKEVGNSFEIITNPLKSDKIIFNKGDAIISLAEE